MNDFSQLLLEAEERPFSGWDFSYDGRISSTFPWNYESIVVSHARHSSDMLDLGTGGGEWLSRLPFRPRRTIATEGWEPNVPIARQRLQPLGIDVIQVEKAPDNTEQGSPCALGRLPFPDGSFNLITNRHEAFVASEVARVLAGGGRFLTEQVASGFNDDFYRLLSAPIPLSATPLWTLDLASTQVREAGLLIEASDNGFETLTFTDVGALAWYLKNLPFVFPDFSIESFRPQLHRLHLRFQSGEPLTIHQRIFLLAARKPAPNSHLGSSAV